MSKTDQRLPVTKETKNELKQLGNKGDTYDEIIQKLLKQSKKEVDQ